MSNDVGSRPAMPDRRPTVCVVIPVLNEVGNIPELFSQLDALTPSLNMHLILVDGGSTDGTLSAARAAIPAFRGQTLIFREARPGIGAAYEYGFAAALDTSAAYIVTMDADLSHPIPALLPVVELAGKAQVVIGSRYVDGARIDGRWGSRRAALSRLANMAARARCGLRTRDATSGFRLYRREVIERWLAAENKLVPGFASAVQMTNFCEHSGYTIEEYPISFGARFAGRSKMSIRSVFVGAYHLWTLPLPRRP